MRVPQDTNMMQQVHCAALVCFFFHMTRLNMWMPCSDIVYCPKDEEDDMRGLLKKYGGKPNKTAQQTPARRDNFIYVAPDD